MKENAFNNYNDCKSFSFIIVNLKKWKLQMKIF